MTTTTTTTRKFAGQPAAPAWVGEYEAKRIFLGTGKFKNGKEILRPVTIRYIIINRSDREAIRFTVTHITKYEGRGENKRPVFRNTTICDHRDEQSGHTGTKGRWGTREGYKPGRAKSYTPSGWVSEVARFVGEARAWELLREAGYAG